MTKIMEYFDESHSNPSICSFGNRNPSISFDTLATNLAIPLAQYRKIDGNFMKHLFSGTFTFSPKTTDLYISNFNNWPANEIGQIN